MRSWVILPFLKPKSHEAQKHLLLQFNAEIFVEIQFSVGVPNQIVVFWTTQLTHAHKL